MMTMLLVFRLTMLIGYALSEPGGRLVRDEDCNLDCNADIALLKKQMASQIVEISQLRQQLLQWEDTKGNVFDVPERRLILDEMDYDAEITLLKQQVSKLVQQSKGATYVRWGRSTCDGIGTSTVYSGFMAGSYAGSATAGSGSDYLCLADDPVWGHYTNTVDNNILITGVEYNFHPHEKSDIADFFGSNLLGHQAPCAVCHVDRGASIMIPGRTTCYGNWTAEYDGYLVTGYAGFDDSTEYVCLDKRPESVIGGGTFQAKNSMFLVEATCDFDLECPPYENGREVPCVVCSK